MIEDVPDEPASPPSITFQELIRIVPIVEMLLDVPFDGIYITDRNRRIIFWNKGAENITGFSAREVMGHRCSDNILNHIDENGRLLCKADCPLERCMASRTPIKAKIFPKNKAGHRLPTLTHAAPLKDIEGRVVGGIEVFRDISHEDDLQQLQRKFNSIIKKYVSNATYNEVLVQASTSREASAELLDQTIMYVDVVQFTAFAESVPPPEVKKALDVLFDLCEVQVSEFHGDIDKFIGDAVMAIFDDANDALQAAVRILSDVQHMNELRKREEKTPLLVRIGINSGMVIHGEVGSAKRKEVTVLGDPVNTAARVQAMAQPSTLYVTESTIARLKRQDVFKHVGEVRLKGKSVDVKVFQYVGPDGGYVPEEGG
jgi:PAS domain S-box-containing protein